MSAQAPESGDFLIAEIDKNKRESFRVMLRSYKGHRFVDLRLYFHDSEDRMMPGAKGVSFPPAFLDFFIEALQNARERAVAEGILPRSPNRED